MYSVEICAGAGGQALGLEQAGFEHIALVEIDHNACATLKKNRPLWNVVGCDVASFSAKKYLGVDLLAGGVPCPPFSVAGKQLGQLDGRDLFPEALRLVAECNPKAVMLENVRGLFAQNLGNYLLNYCKSLPIKKTNLTWNATSCSLRPMMWCNGQIRTHALPNIGRVIRGAIRGTICADSMLYTDEHQSYVGMPEYRHRAVCCSAKQFLDETAHTNGIESVWSVLRWGFYGI